MVPKVVVLEHRRHKLAPEEELIWKHAHGLGIPVITTSLKEMSRGHEQLSSRTLVAGGVSFIKHALRQYQRLLPEDNPYPECLSHLLYRKVKRLRTLREAKAMLDKGQRLFIKPVACKVFTGFVATSSDDWRFNGTSNSAPVFVSELVSFINEWRAYVIKGELISFQPCPSWIVTLDEPLKPDMDVVIDGIRRMTESGQAAAAYAIDFGVLSTGETALVEVNDGFSIGAYGTVTKEQYWDFIAARWSQLIG